MMNRIMRVIELTRRADDHNHFSCLVELPEMFFMTNAYNSLRWCDILEAFMFPNIFHKWLPDGSCPALLNQERTVKNGGYILGSLGNGILIWPLKHSPQQLVVKEVISLNKVLVAAGMIDQALIKVNCIIQNISSCLAAHCHCDTRSLQPYIFRLVV